MATGSGTVAAAEAPLPPLPDGAFTVVVVPDTQHYLGPGTKLKRKASKADKFRGDARYASIDGLAWADAEAAKTPDEVTNPFLRRHVDWILERRDEQNIAFVTHVGDIVEIDRPEEWRVAAAELDRLRGRVPFGLVVGNHDMAKPGDARNFQAAFPAASFADEPWYVGCFGPDDKTGPRAAAADSHVSIDNVNSAQTVDVGGVRLLLVHLECNAPDDVLAWAGRQIDAHPDRRVVVVTHMDLGIREKPTTEAGYIHDPKGRMRWAKRHGDDGNTPEQMWDKLYRRHPRIDLVLSGDQSRVTAMRQTDRADDGHPIHALLSDYMSLGPLRLLRFVPSRDGAIERVDVVTYDTALDRLVEAMPYAPDRDAHQFSIPFGSNR